MILRSRRVIRFSLLMTMFMTSDAGWAAGGGPWSYGIEASVMLDDNVGRSQHAADIEKDTVLSGAGDISYTWGFSELTAFTVIGTGAIEEFSDFEGLSNTRLGVTGDFRFQTRIGFTAIQYSTFLRFEQLDSETDIRDADTIEFGFRATKRMTDIITGTAGLTISESEADGRVFDLERTRYFVNADYRINNRWSAYATLNYIDGDVFSTATPDLEILNAATDNGRNVLTPPIEPDNAFGGAANNKLVYRLDAKTTILRLGGNYGINQRNAIDFSVDILDSDAVGSIQYDRLSTAVTYLRRF
ncbi:MAG TPA: hypothetical protein VGL10_10385 [Gammaproteobacteria bacterium]